MYKAPKVFCLVVFLFSVALSPALAVAGPLDITCPNDMSAHNGGNVSSNYTVTDPDYSGLITLTYRVDPPGDSITNVVLHPSSGYAPFTGHVHFDSHCRYPGVYKIWLKAFDGTSYDSCYFQVTVYNDPPQITCPADDSPHAGEHFTSTNVVLYDPNGDGMSWVYLYTTPTPVNEPYKSVMHMEWEPTCDDFFNGPVFTIFLEVTDDCGKKGTCSFQVTVTDEPPQIICPHDTSVHAGKNFISSNFFAYDPDDPTGVVESLSVSPTPTNTPTLVGNHVEWNTTCEDLVIGPTFTITLVATDPCGLKDTCEFTVNVYNQPPVLTCPDDDSVHAGDGFVSTNFSVIDPESDTVTVALCGIAPTPTNPPSIVGSHVEWQTACADTGKIFTICLEATDSCGAKDTCYFHVTVYNQPPQITCPDDDSVHAGDKFVSTIFSVTDPDTDSVTVALCGVTPTPTNPPIIVNSHVEWQTSCADTGITICLEATDSCGAKDTCYFHVTVYNQPPQLTCPANDTIQAGDTLKSTNFSVTDPENDPTTVTFLEIAPGATNTPTIVNSHVEWVTTCSEMGVYTIRLEAADSCGAKDTCEFQVTVIDQPPDITCPDSMRVHSALDTTSGNFTVNGSVGDSIVQIQAWVSPAGTGITGLTVFGGTGRTPTTGHVEFDANCGYPGIYKIWLKAINRCGLKDSCSFQVRITNLPPQIVCPSDTSADVGHFISSDFGALDPEGLPYTVQKGISPTPANMPYIVGNHVEWDITPGDVGNIYTITLIVTDDCGATDSCFFHVNVGKIPPRLGEVVIPNTVYQRYDFNHDGIIDSVVVHACVNPGDFFEIPIIFDPPLDPDHPGIGGFELEVEFDYLDLTFFGAERGDLLKLDWTYGGVHYSWEYFSYRVLPCPLCACCKYKILLYGQAEMPNGPTNLGYCLGPTGNLAWLKFQVANNDLLRDLKLPIKFEWEGRLNAVGDSVIEDWDCAENTMSSCDGEVLFVSNNPMQYNPNVCGQINPPQHVPDTLLTFIDGGVHICSPGPGFKCTRGDINLDHIANTTADAVLFANYFVHGMTVFYPDTQRAWQICATDVNADGRTLMLADLIYLIRVIQNDAVPFPKLAPSSDVANVIVTDGRITVECASAIGGILFKFDGNVTPTLLNANMELLSNEGNVLVWSSEGHSINAGASQLLTASGANLVSVTAVDREGRDLATTITNKLTPTAFALHPAYPNPFNPNTNLSFTLPNATPYSMKIYNVAGQLVRSYEGMGNVGLNVITWDGKDNLGNDVSSGVYFYKLIAGQYQDTRKMIMVK
jgi:hypothetical protein